MRQGFGRIGCSIALGVLAFGSESAEAVEKYTGDAASLGKAKGLKKMDFESILMQIDSERTSQVTKERSEAKVDAIRPSTTTVEMMLGATLNDKALINNKWVKVNQRLKLGDVTLILLKVGNGEAVVILAPDDATREARYRLSIGEVQRAEVRLYNPSGRQD